MSRICGGWRGRAVRCLAAATGLVVGGSLGGLALGAPSGASGVSPNVTPIASFAAHVPDGDHAAMAAIAAPLQRRLSTARGHDPTGVVCTFNGASAPSIVANVTPGSSISFACTGFAPNDQVVGAQFSPLFLHSMSQDDVDVTNAQTYTADPAGALHGTFVVPNPFTAADPAAVCPPSAAQVAQGYLRCGLILADSTGTLGTLVALSYAVPPSPPLAEPVTGMASGLLGGGYWLVNAQGAVSAHGTEINFGSLAGSPLSAPISNIASTPDGEGYWLVGADGGVFAFGDAGFYGSMGGVRLNAPIVGIAPTLTGHGYWLVGADGGIFAFGNARFLGSMGGQHLNQPMVGIAADFLSGGYWEVAADGGIFAFGAPFLGSTGSIRLNQPVNSMASTLTGQGYWLAANDGGVFAFGNAGFYGSTGSLHLNRPVVGMAASTLTGGYWLVAGDGGVFAFNAPFYGAG